MTAADSRPDESALDPLSSSAVAAGPLRRVFHHLPPVYSPLSAGALTRALLTAAAPATDPARELRSILTRDYEARDILLTDSGTSALELAIRFALRPIAGGGIVALPAFSCYDMATAAVGSGAGIVLYDLDPGTLSPSLESLEAALRAGAGAVVVAPLYGMPVDWDPIESLVRAHGAVLVEDAAQGHGAFFRGRRLGSLASLSVLSFGRGKGWTGGGGGALLRRGDDVSGIPVARPTTRSAAAAFVGAAAQWLLGRPSVYRLPASLPWLGLGETHYRAPGEPQAQPAVMAALALATHLDAETEAAARRRRAAGMLLRLRSPLVAISVPAGGEPGYLRLPVLAPDGAEVVDRLHHLGVARSYPGTLAALPAVRSRLVPGASDTFPGADALVSRLVTLPTHSLLTDWDVDAITS